MDAGRLADAVAFGLDHEIDWPTDLTQQSVSDDDPQFSAKIGPSRPRGGPAGLVLRRGRIVAEWGDVERVDLTFSATKSYVATVAGLAFDRGRLDLDGLVADSEVDVSLEYAPRAIEAIARLRQSGQDARTNLDDSASIDGFGGPNQGITWRHLLQQTSEWEGWLFGKPDTVDWNRGVETSSRRQDRQLPGGHWEYNDVRVNRAALALLALWQEPLPAVLKREVMDPIGASAGWQWHGYGDHSTVLVDGVEIESVSGGAHWGGGLWIDCLDHARFGLLFANEGVWDGRQVLSEAWCRQMVTPCERNPSYGLMWWLNNGHQRYSGSGTSESAFAASGAGGNSVLVDTDLGLVVVTRWCADVPAVVGRVVRAINS